MQQADTKDQKNESNRQNRTRDNYTCVDGVDVLVPNETFRFPEWNENSSDSTYSEMTFMNGIVYTIDKERRLSGIQIFVSESEFDRSVSAISGGAQKARTIAFPSTVKDVRSCAFKRSK